MQNSQLPLKWYKPFAADDAAKVEIPVTTANPLRASQSLGFPPLTMQPPESGGVPPEGEDFNGAMNQVARVAWWMLAGGALPFDNAWANNANIGGYPQGATVAAADLLGEWFSTADNNTNNPDTNGASWVPGYAYGATSLTGLTNANVTLTPAQAAKSTLRLAGALTGNIQIIFPIWLKDWIVINNCTGAFSITCKTAAGSGVVVSQGGGAQIVIGDGTNLSAPLQTSGRLLRTSVYMRIAGVQNISINGGAPTTVGAGTFMPLAATAYAEMDVQGAGSGGAGATGATGGNVSLGAPGCAGSFAKALLPAATVGTSPLVITVGLGSAGGVGGASAVGGTSSVGALVTAPGGTAANTFANQVPPTANGNSVPSTAPTGGNVISAQGYSPNVSIAQSASTAISGAGGAGFFGAGSSGQTLNTNATAATNPGSGGGGVVVNSGGGTATAGAGAPGIIIIREYA